MTVSYDYTGQVALVTGASAGMGFAAARAFARSGASTVLVDINETAVRTAADCDASPETADTDNATFDRLVAVNLTGVWNSLKDELLQMRKQQSGATVNISSIAGLKGGRVRSAYTATKHAVPRPHQVRGSGGGRPPHPRQRGVPWHRRNPDGRANDRRWRARRQRLGGRLSSHPTARPSRRDR